ncbi:MAG: zinc ribbon domain-containing protein [Eubacterium sp.]|nr:zinc ribbon domain-containing protein [Eubacterium sp.]
MKCPICGKDTPDNTPYCIHCGSVFGGTTDAAVNARTQFGEARTQFGEVRTQFGAQQPPQVREVRTQFGEMQQPPQVREARTQFGEVQQPPQVREARTQFGEAQKPPANLPAPPAPKRKNGAAIGIIIGVIALVVIIAAVAAILLGRGRHVDEPATDTTTVTEQVETTTRPQETTTKKQTTTAAAATGSTALEKKLAGNTYRIMGRLAKDLPENEQEITFAKGTATLNVSVSSKPVKADCTVANGVLSVKFNTSGNTFNLHFYALDGSRYVAYDCESDGGYEIHDIIIKEDNYHFESKDIVNYLNGKSVRSEYLEDLYMSNDVSSLNFKIDKQYSAMPILAEYHCNLDEKTFSGKGINSNLAVFTATKIGMGKASFNMYVERNGDDIQALFCDSDGVTVEKW